MADESKVQVTLAPPVPPSAKDGMVDLWAHPHPLSLLADADPQLAANKRLVFDMWRSVVNAGHEELADSMLAEGYIQHSPVISTGREAFKKVFAGVERRKIPDVVSPPLITILAENDLVVMALREEMKGPDGRPFVTTHFNLFRIAGGRLAEHWHSVELPPGPATPPPEAGGPQRVTGRVGDAQLDLLRAADPTLAANKRLVFDAWRTVFEATHEDEAERFVAAAYVEHDPNHASGRKALTARLASFPDKSVESHVSQPVVAVVAQANLVVLVTARVHPHPARRGETYTTTGFDMFRMADGWIAEHWTGDALAGAPPPVYD
ncbi:nuclear transport factor 2 family protein [Croceibacterium aestuarii]|uniref:nuclear transport factor 2 family protein n=1 Tax=Croceibacterium aestuarii TaxID=3064139 RepID=UPI00272E4167|nr:nuclear transport factor 2 family protein [Croceibacterium sp. D39]